MNGIKNVIGIDRVQCSGLEGMSGVSPDIIVPHDIQWSEIPIQVPAKLSIINKVRAQGIRAEIYPDTAKMKKQMSYANAKQIPFVALAGENEMKEGKITLKNMETGEQQMVTPEELIGKL